MPIELHHDALVADDGTKLLLVSGPKLTKQQIEVELGTILGTYKYNQRVGLPWLGAVSEKGAPRVYEAEVRKYFQRHPRIRAVRSLEFSLDTATRLLSVAFVVVAVDGEVIEADLPFRFL